MKLGKGALVLTALLLLGGGLLSADDKPGDWIVLFNGKDLTGWKLRHEKATVKKIVDKDGAVIAGAKTTKLDQTDAVVDAKNQPLKDAKVARIDNKAVAVDAEGKPLKDAKIIKIGGREAIVDKDGKELKDAKQVTETVTNTNGGWKVEDGILISGNGPHNCDIFTEQKFTNFELHVEFQGNDNSGVYLQGLYEIQVINSFGAKPKLVEKDGKQIETFDSHQCGAIYGRIAPSKNMAKPPKEWQTFDVVFHGAREEAGKTTKKARVTLIWNGEKVIDNAEIEGPTGSALAGKTTDPGPLLLQGDHGKVPFRNVKIRPLPEK